MTLKKKTICLAQTTKLKVKDSETKEKIITMHLQKKRVAIRHKR